MASTIGSQIAGRGEGYCYLRAPAGSSASRLFGVALVQEFERVHDFEPLFVAEYNSDASQGSSSPSGGAVQGASERRTVPLNSPDFTFRLLRLLERRGVISYAVPTVSPLLELDEAIIHQCREEVEAEHSRRFDVDDGVTVANPARHAAGSSQRRATDLGASQHSVDETARRDQAKQFELLQQRLVMRWEAEVKRKWIAMQPLYSVEGDVGSMGHGDLLCGREVSLAYFSHIDVLTFCILDLFKSASARGPGGNTGDWSPYLQQRGRPKLGPTENGAGPETQVGVGVDATGRPLLETLSWQRFVMYLADCSPQPHTNTSLEGIRIFLPPKASRVLPPPGSSLADHGEGASAPIGRRVNALDKYHSRHGDAFDLGRVRIAKIWNEKGISLLLTSPPKDASAAESLYFIANLSMRCIRVQALSNRHGNVMTMEIVSLHNSLACSYVDGVRLYDIDTFAIKTFVPEVETVTAMRFFPELDRLAVGNRVGDLRIYSSLGAVDRQYLHSLSRVSTEPAAQSDPAGSLPRDPSNLSTVPNDLIHVETTPKQHTEAICDILPSVINDCVIVSSSLDNSLSFFNVDTRSSRRSVGDAVVLGATSIPSLGLLFCFGVDLWPFVWSYNVVGSRPLSLAGGGSSVGKVATVAKAGGGGPSDKQHHGARIVSVHSLVAPRYSAVSLDANGGVRVWDLWRMCLLQSIEIGAEGAGSNVPYFRSQSGCASAFTHFLFDATRVRFYSFVRQRAFTIRYNKRDDLRTTMLASFDQLTRVHVSECSRILVSVSKRGVTVWDLVTARVVVTVSIPVVFSALMLQTHATLKQLANEAAGSDQSEASDQDTAGEFQAATTGRGQKRSPYAGLDIVCSQLLEDSRSILLGLSCGGIVMCSIGNGSIVCFIPPIPYFYGSSGLLSDDGMTAGQEIAAAARFSGDFYALFYHVSQDTLFMSGAGHTFYEFRGRRQELLADGTTPVDATAFLFHSYTGLLLIAESSGVVSAWVQQDQVVHIDSWYRVSHTLVSEAGSDPCAGLLEIPSTSFFVSYSSVGTVSLYRIELDLETAKQTDDPSGFYLFPGASLRKDQHVSPQAEHRRFFRLSKRFAEAQTQVFAPRRMRGAAAPSRSEPKPQVEWPSREMNGSILKHYRRQNILLRRDRNPRGERRPLSPAVPACSSPSRDGVIDGSPAGHVSSDQITHALGASISSSDSDVSDGPPTLTTERSVGGAKARGAEASMRRLRARGVLLKSRGVAASRFDNAQSTGCEVVHQTGETAPTRASVHLSSPPHSVKKTLSRSEGPTSNIASNSLVQISLCSSWAHLRLNPLVHEMPARVDASMCAVTSVAYSAEYSFLYVGDASGCVSIYDLCAAVGSPRDLMRWEDLLAKQSAWEDSQCARDEACESDPTSQPLPQFTPVSLSPEVDRQNSLPKGVRCVRRVAVHTSSVTSIHVTQGAFGCVHTSSLDGTLQAWSLFLNRPCGSLTLGEHTTSSVYRYPSFSVSSREGDALLRTLDIDLEAEQHSTCMRQGADVPSRAEKEGRALIKAKSSASLTLPSAIGQRLTEIFMGETQFPIFMLPSQLLFQMPEFIDAVRSASDGVSRVRTRAADPGGPCQQSAADCAHYDSYQSARGKRAMQVLPRHVQWSRNDTTRAVLAALSAYEYASLRSLVVARHPTFIEIEPALTTQDGLEAIAIPHGVMPSEVHVADAARTMQSASSPPPSELYLTTAGIHLLTTVAANRCSVYDDVPRPYNSTGAMEVPHQPAFDVLPPPNGDGQGDGLSASLYLSPRSLASPRLADLSDATGGLPDEGGVPLSTYRHTTNIDAVVQYKEWCMGQHRLLESFAAAHGPQRNPHGMPGSTIPENVERGARLPPIGALARDLEKAPGVRMTDVVKIFRGLHSASVGDVEDGLGLPSHTSTDPTGTGGTECSLPPIFRRSDGGYSQRLCPVRDADESRDTHQLSPSETIRAGIETSCAIVNKKRAHTRRIGPANSQQILNAFAETRQSEAFVGHPPLISSALAPARGVQLSNVKTGVGEDDDSGVDEESISSEESFDGDAWKAIIDHQRLERERRGDAQEALAALSDRYQKEFSNNKSKAALLSTIRNGGVVDQMVKVFSKGTMHSTLAFLLSQEQDLRLTRSKLGAASALGANTSGSVSHEVVKAYCESFQKRKSLADLLESTPPIGARLGKNGDTSGLRPDVSSTLARSRWAHAAPQGPQSQSAGMLSPLVAPARLSDTASPHAVVSSGVEPSRHRPQLDTREPLGRPISPYVLRKCTHDDFKGLLTNRLLASVGDRQKLQERHLDDPTAAIDPSRRSAPRLKDGLSPTLPLRSRKSKQ